MSSKLKNITLLLSCIVIAGFLSRVFSNKHLDPKAPRKLVVAKKPTSQIKISKKNTLGSSIKVSLENIPTKKTKEIIKPKNALDGEINLSFNSEKKYRDFLKKIYKLNPDLILSKIDALKTIRLLRDSDLLANDLIQEADEFGFNYLVQAPIPPADETGRGSAQFEDSVLDSLGVPPNNSDWGEGVKVAVLDTAVEEHQSLQTSSLETISVLDETTSDVSSDQAHGTAVASLIAASGDEFSGVAPKAEILGIEVLDSSGSGTTFSVAQGIIEAVDAGANIINMSLSTSGESRILRDAIEYAEEAGVLLVAAAGNSEQGAIPYPAKYENVIAVTAIDAQNLAAPFSNTAEEIDIAAPGVGLLSTSGDDGFSLWNGTSFSAPLVSGAAAAFLSQNPELEPSELRQAILGNTRDLGLPGEDTVFGLGGLDIGRLVNSTTPGIFDLAIADHHVREKPDTNNQVIISISVQNVGTETVRSSNLRVRIDNRNLTKTVKILNPGQVDFVEITKVVDPTTTNTISIASVIESDRDQNASNNSKSNVMQISIVAE